MAKNKSAAKKEVRKKVPIELAKTRKTSRTLQEGVKNPKRFYKNVGLVADPNKALGKKKNKINIVSKKPQKEKIVSEFVQELERKANRPIKKKFKFGTVMCEELEYYIEKYGDDYESMARDNKNIYQDSPGQLRYKILKYNKIHKHEQ